MCSSRCGSPSKRGVSPSLARAASATSPLASSSSPPPIRAVAVALPSTRVSARPPSAVDTSAVCLARSSTASTCTSSFPRWHRPTFRHRLPASTTDAIRARVSAARQRQRARFRAAAIRVNAAMTPRQVRRFCEVPADAERLLAAAMTRLGLSARGHDRVLKVARTIADLAGAEDLAVEHCAEAIQYRGLDRQWRA